MILWAMMPAFGVPSLLPDLFTYQLFVPVLLRLVVGWIFLNSARKYLQQGDKMESLLEGVPALFLVAGLLTQAAAVVLLILSLRPKFSLQRSAELRFLLVVVLVSILVLGPGFLSVDLPL